MLDLNFYYYVEQLSTLNSFVRSEDEEHHITAIYESYFPTSLQALTILHIA